MIIQGSSLTGWNSCQLRSPQIHFSVVAMKFCIALIALLVLGELLALPEETDGDVDKEQSALKTIQGYLEDFFLFPEGEVMKLIRFLKSLSLYLKTYFI